MVLDEVTYDVGPDTEGVADCECSGAHAGLGAGGT